MSKDSNIVQAMRRSIEDFRGDYQALASVVERSWEENSQQGLCHTAEFLQSLLTSPGVTSCLMPAMYEGDTLLGFAAGFPRRVRHKGQPLRLVTNTLLSVLPEYKRSGFGIVLWTELVKRIRAGGFDGMVNFCVDGEQMNRMIEGSCRRLNLPVHRVISIRYMSAVLKPGQFTPSTVRPELSSLGDFLDLAAPLTSSQPLAREWTADEANWQCLDRTGAVFAHAKHESRRGILTGYVMPILDSKRTKCLLVEDVFWEELQPEERVQLLRQFLAQAVEQGAEMASVPMLGYADLSAFKKFRFFPTRRVLHCYLTLFDSNVTLETLPSMYLDVF